MGVSSAVTTQLPAGRAAARQLRGRRGHGLPPPARTGPRLRWPRTRPTGRRSDGAAARHEKSKNVVAKGDPLTDGAIHRTARTGRYDNLYSSSASTSFLSTRYISSLLAPVPGGGDERTQ